VQVSKEHLTKHIVAKPVINFIKNLEPFEESYRNLLAQHYPEDRSTGPRAQHFQLTRARISGCKEFCEEDVALLETSEKILGIAQTPLSEADKFWLSQVKNGDKELLKGLINDKRRTPHFLLLM
jgi:hypothetical protein